MRAALCASYGPPDVVRLARVPPPELGPGCVRVRVRAAAVNFPDVLIVAGRYQLRVPPPFVSGSEFAGVVEEVTEGVSALEVGERVAGSLLVGAFAEEVVVDPSALRRIPEHMDFRVAAASGVSHATAYHALRSFARIEGGERLVVLGAGGGVGLAAVQLGAQLGASVIAVASSAEKRAVARARGATHAVDPAAGPLRDALRTLHPEGVDVVVDPVGGALAEPALRSLRFGGRFVSVGYASGDVPSIPLHLVLLKGVTVCGFQIGDLARHAPGAFQRHEDELQALRQEGRASAHVGATFPLAEVAAALRCVAEGRAVGKVVVAIPG